MQDDLLVDDDSGSCSLLRLYTSSARRCKRDVVHISKNASLKKCVKTESAHLETAPGKKLG